MARGPKSKGAADTPAAEEAAESIEAVAEEVGRGGVDGAVAGAASSVNAVQETAADPRARGERVQEAGEQAADDLLADAKDDNESSREFLTRSREVVSDTGADLASAGRRAVVEPAEDAVEAANAATESAERGGSFVEDLGEVGADLGRAGQKAAADAAELGGDDDGFLESGPIDVVRLPSAPGPDIAIPFPDLGADEDAEAVAEIGVDLADAGEQAVADTADAAGIEEFDITDPFGAGTGTEANPLLNEEFGSGAGIPVPIDTGDFGGGADRDGDGDTDGDDLGDIIGEAAEDAQDEGDDFLDDLADAADSDGDGDVDADDAEDAAEDFVEDVEDATGLDLPDVF